jgi:signal transduction histidine kinase
VIGALSLSRLAGAPAYAAIEQWLIEELAHRAAAAIENAELMRAVRRAVVIRDEFLSVAGHELRTPVTAVLLQIENVVQAANRGEPPAALGQRSERAVSRLERLIRLIDAMLDVGRIDAGRLRLEPVRFALADAVDEVVARLGDDAARAGSTLTTRLDRSVIGEWDRFRVEQILENLVTNAIKYGARKPIEIAVERRAGGGARLTVRDRGIGIAVADRARIFQRFERAVSSSNFGGLGLGLWIARELVEQLGGAIRVESVEGEGSCFEVEL